MKQIGVLAQKMISELEFRELISHNSFTAAAQPRIYTVVSLLCSVHSCLVILADLTHFPNTGFKLY